MSVVTLYGRPGCHLCDEARALITGLRKGGVPLELREVDIEADEELLRAYLERIPVVEVDGDVVSELEPEPAALRVALGLGDG